jgi:HEAT repeat protein
MRDWLWCAAVLCWLSFSTPSSLAQETYLGRSFDEWIEQLATSPGTKRIAAAEAIAHIAGRSAGSPQDAVFFAELVNLINDGEPQVRFWGVTGLASFGDQLGKNGGGQTAVVNTLQPLLEDKSPAPRIAAAQSLALLGPTAKPLAVLVAALEDRQESVRIQAVTALGKIGSAAQPVKQALFLATRDHSDTIRQLARRALDRLEDKQQ